MCLDLCQSHFDYLGIILEWGGERVIGSKQGLCIISWGHCMLIPMQNQFDLGRLSWDGVANKSKTEFFAS